MKGILIFVSLIICLPFWAQTHRIGINGGVNTMKSWDGSPALGIHSPFHSRIGFSSNLSYSFILKNRFTLNFHNGLTILNFKTDNTPNLLNGERVLVDLKLFHHIYHTSIGGGYLFRLNDRFSMEAEAGSSLLIYFRQISYLVGYPETRIDNTFDWRNANRRYHVFYLALNSNYRLYKSQTHGVYLTGSLRATQVFNYLKINQNLNRIIPELNIGVAVVFGDYWYRKF